MRAPTSIKRPSKIRNCAFLGERGRNAARQPPNPSETGFAPWIGFRAMESAGFSSRAENIEMAAGSCMLEAKAPIQSMVPELEQINLIIFAFVHSYSFPKT